MNSSLSSPSHSSLYSSKRSHDDEMNGMGAISPLPPPAKKNVNWTPAEDQVIKDNYEAYTVDGKTKFKEMAHALLPGRIGEDGKGTPLKNRFYLLQKKRKVVVGENACAKCFDGSHCKVVEPQAAEHEAAEHEVAEHDATEHEAAERKAAERKERKAAERKAAERKARLSRRLKRAAAERKAAERKAAERKARLSLRLKRAAAQLEVDDLSPVDTARVQREAIVRDTMSNKGDVTEVELTGGWIADAVNFTSSSFTEYKKLDKHASLTARGQIMTYGARLKQEHGHSFKSRIVFFSEKSEADANALFHEILEDYRLSPFGLDEAVLVHMSNVDTANHSADLKELKSVCF